MVETILDVNYMELVRFNPRRARGVDIDPRFQNGMYFSCYTDHLCMILYQIKIHVICEMLMNKLLTQDSFFF